MSHAQKIAFIWSIYTGIFASFGIFLGIFTRLAPSVTLFLTLLYGGIGFLFAVTSTYRIRMAHRRAFDQKQKVQADYSVHQERTIEIDLPYQAAFDLCLEALETLDNQAIMLPKDPVVKWLHITRTKQSLVFRKTDRAQGYIEGGLRTRTFGFRDFSDFLRISMRLESLDSETIRIHIDSRPPSRFVLYDLGMSLHIVNHLALYLRQQSIEHTAQLRSTQAESKIYIVDLPFETQKEISYE